MRDAAERDEGASDPLMSYFHSIDDSMWLYLIDLALLEALVIYTWKFRDMPGAKTYLLTQTAKGFWLFFLVLSSLSDAMSTKLFWIYLQQMMAIVTPYLWMLFVWELSRPERRLPKSMKYGFAAVVGYLWIVLLLPAGQATYWNKVEYVGTTLQLTFGPNGWLALINSYVLCLISTFLSVQWVLNSDGLQRQQALWFVLPPLFTWLGHFLSRIPAFWFLAPQAFGFLLSGSFVAWAYYRWRMYSILPLAQDVAAQNMIDGLLVIDEAGYLVGINPAGQQILHDLPIAVGDCFAEQMAGWSDLAVFSGQSGKEESELKRDVQGRIHYYQVSRIPLTAGSGYRLGRIILLTDITRSKQDQEKLLAQQKALSVLMERDRLGREIHDGPGQFWSYLNMQVGAIRSLIEKNRIKQADSLLVQLAEVSQELHTDIRESIRGLQRPSGIKESFLSTLEDYAHWYRKTYAIDVSLAVDEAFRDKLLMPPAKVQLLRVIQEALTNVRKHARAHTVQIRFQVKNEQVQFYITDDGCGFDREEAAKQPDHFGLTIMQERLKEIGGNLAIQSELQQGTTLCVTVPISPSGSRQDPSEEEKNNESFIG